MEKELNSSNSKPHHGKVGWVGRVPAFPSSSSPQVRDGKTEKGNVSERETIGDSFDEANKLVAYGRNLLFDDYMQ